MTGNMRIQKKLVFAFVLIGLFSVIVGMFGLVTVYITNGNTNDIYSGHFIPTTYLYDIQKNLLQVNNNYNLLLYEKDILQSKKRVGGIDGWIKSNKELLKQYETVKTSLQDSGYEALKRDMQACYEVMDKMNVLLVSNDIAAAMNVAPDFHSRMDLVNKDILRLIELETKTAGTSLVQSQNAFITSAAAIVGITLICLLLAVGTGILISRKISRPIMALASAAERLAEGDAEIELKAESKDEIGDLVNSFSRMVSNIKEQADVARQIAEGSLELDIQPRSDRDILGLSMHSVVITLRKLVETSGEMTQTALKGEISKRGDSAQFFGGYHDIIAGFNQTLDAVVEPLKKTSGYLRQISRGEIPELIEEGYPGDFNEIRESLNKCVGAVSLMMKDVDLLSEAAISGKLSMRAEESNHEGDFRKIITGVNGTLDAITKPLSDAAEYMEKIGRGEIPEKIEEVYQGDFENIKDSINSCIEGLGFLEEGSNVLNRMSGNDFTYRAGIGGQGIYKEIAESINDVSDHVEELTGFISHVADGNLEDLDYLSTVGKRSENDTLIPSVILMIETIKALVEETNRLSQSAVEGELSERGHAERFRGEYKIVVEGINRTLDAVIEPIEEATYVLKEMAAGNLRVNMEGDYRGDHGEIKNALNHTIENFLSHIDEISEVLEGLSNGNLDQIIFGDYHGDFYAIKESLNGIIITLKQVMGQINTAADEVAAGSKQVAAESQSLSQGATEQAASVQELSASISEVAEQVKQSAVRADQAREVAASAREYALKGSSQMEHMQSSMSMIDESSSNITKIIKVIEDIAFQTNILALNAAVEAARAGQFGKGFAIVAEEVRGLAARSGEAARRISDMIVESKGRVKDGVSIANDTGAFLKSIVSSIDKTAMLVSDIAETSGRQSSGIMMIDSGIEQISRVIQYNSAMAEQSAAASEELSVQAQLLTEVMRSFHQEEQQVGILPAPQIPLLAI
jgi:methyl-accepting chemotaxis protein